MTPARCLSGLSLARIKRGKNPLSYTACLQYTQRDSIHLSVPTHASDKQDNLFQPPERTP